MVEAGAAEDDEEEEGEVVHLANGAHDENNNRNTINDGEDDDENDVVKVSNGDKDEKEHGERYFGSLAKEGKAPPGTNPFATKTFASDTKEDIKKMIEDAKRQTEMQRKEREKIEFEEREKERLAAENRGVKYVPRAKAGEGEEGGKGGDVVRRKVVRAKRPGGMSKNDGKEDGNEAKTPNAFASLVSGGVKKAVDESKKEESPQKGSVFSRLSKKGGGEEDKTKKGSPSPEAAKLARATTTTTTTKERKQRPTRPGAFPRPRQLQRRREQKTAPERRRGRLQRLRRVRAETIDFETTITPRRRRTVVVDFRRKRRRKFETIVFVQTVRVRQRARHRDQPFEL